MRKRFWELGGSAMGNAMGIAHEEAPEEDKKPSAMELGGQGDSDDEVSMS